MARCLGLGTNLTKENEPEEYPLDFPSTHKVNNVLYTLLVTVFYFDNFFFIPFKQLPS